MSLILGIQKSHERKQHSGLVPERGKDTSSLWAILQVCSRWRKIAIAEPLLWNRLSFHESSLSFTSLLELAHDVLSNCGGQGIVTLEARPSCEDEWDTILHLISTYPSRLRNLKFGSGFTQPKSFSTPLELFNYMESLDITISKQSDDTTPPLHAFAIARSLRIVTICALANVFPNRSISLLLPSSQLTTLTTAGVPLPILHFILSQCVHLINCTITLFWPSTMQMPHGTNSIIMRNLECLSIDHENDEDFLGFMEHLILPKLKTLKLYTSSGQLPYDKVLKIISHSACTLETFSTNYSMSEGQIIPLMKAMPGLTQLETLNLDQAISDSTLDTIVIERLCPKLRILSGWTVASLEPFWEFLQRRGEASSPHFNPYGGIQEVTIQMEMDDLFREYKLIRPISAQFQTNGRRFTVTVIPDPRYIPDQDDTQ